MATVFPCSLARGPRVAEECPAGTAKKGEEDSGEPDEAGKQLRRQGRTVGSQMRQAQQSKWRRTVGSRTRREQLRR